MRSRAGIAIGVATIALIGMSNGARAGVVSDQPAAIVIWPDVVSDIDFDTEGGREVNTDTIFQVSNTSLEPVSLHCFHENANYHCSNTGEVCTFAADCCEGSDGCGLCEPGWLETDFRINLTPRQPIGWVASEGLGRGDLPLDGSVGNTGIGGASNAGTLIPAVPEQPYTGVLKCISINPDGTPSDRNVVKGESTRLSTLFGEGDVFSVAKHNAIGIRAIEGAVNDDNELIIGGGGAEYEGCPEHLIVNHLFDGVVDPILSMADIENGHATASGVLIGGEPNLVFSRLTLVPCTQDLLRQIPGSAVIQFLVYNEFEQRFSTSRSAECKFEHVLSLIDTTDPERSIFSAGVSGTVVGQSRLRAIGSGLVGVLTEGRFSSAGASVVSGGLTSAPPRKMQRSLPLWHYPIISELEQLDVNIHQQGDRSESDIITLP